MVTADALQTHPDAAEFLVACKQARYLFMVKANRPTLLGGCAGLPWHRVPVLDHTRDRAPGRVELRSLKAVTVHHFGFPHAAQILQVTRKTRDLHNTRRWRTVTVYAITSLAFSQTSLPASPTTCEITWRSKTACTTCATPPSLRTPPRSASDRPQRHGCLRNLAIGVLSRAGPTNLAAALATPPATPPAL